MKESFEKQATKRQKVIKSENLKAKLENKQISVTKVDRYMFLGFCKMKNIA